MIVVDNGSEDGSAALARRAGATVIEEPRRGYGQAYLTGFAAACGDYIVMIDADLSYDFDEIPRFVEALERRGRARDGQPHGLDRPRRDVPPSRIGNPILSGFPQPPALDAGQGRSLRHARASPRGARRARAALDRDGVRLRDGDPRLEGRARGARAPDRAARPRRRVEALAVSRRLAPPAADPDLQPDVALHHPRVVDGRARRADRHRRARPPEVFGRALYVHTLIAASALAIVGTQIVGLGFCGRAYAVYVMGERDRWLERMQRRFRLEHGLLLGLGVASLGLASAASWSAPGSTPGFGSLGEEQLAVVAMTLVVVGVQIFFTSFLLSLLGLRRR